LRHVTLSEHDVDLVRLILHARPHHHSDEGSIDGIDLTRFLVGQIYEMGPSLGNYLMASGYAVPALDKEPESGRSLDEAESAPRRQ
jgi:hypothetical protein